MKGTDALDNEYVSAAELRQKGRAVRPKDAATLIIVRTDDASGKDFGAKSDGAGSRSEPSVLLGKRAATHKFMPNKFVFPGGKVDRGDGRIQPPHDLHPAVMARLTTGCSATRARALALAAIRETYEETGLILGEPETPTIKTRSPAWADFLQHDINPRLDILQYVARAITPPYRNRRFDARFFMVDAKHIQSELHERPQGSGELLDLHWVTLSKAKEIEQLPHITRAVLTELERRLQEGEGPEATGPFVHTRNGKQVVDSV